MSDKVDDTTRTTVVPGTRDSASTTDGKHELLREEIKQSLHPGAKLDRYVIIEHVSDGGMGAVYKAYDPKLDRLVALKLMPEAKEDSGARSTQLLNEARALARLSHPNTIAVYDAGVVDGVVFIAMEFVEGQTLRDWLHMERRKPAEVLGVFIAAGRGLAAAHHAGLVHRDFKPGNVLLAGDGRPRVLDFGIAVSTATAAQEVQLPDGKAGTRWPISMITSDERVTGTPAYMSPEQYRGEPLDARSDQFSFCASLYEALFGMLPFRGRKVDEIRQSVLAGKIRQSELPPLVTARLRDVVHRGLEIDPDKRFATMEELIEALEEHTDRGTHQACERAAAAKIEDALNHSLEQAMEAAFVATGRPHARDMCSRTIEILRSYAQAWQAKYIEVWEATHLRGEQSAELLDFRMRFLDRSLSELRALIKLFVTEADAALIDRALQAVHNLPSIARCDDIEAVRAANSVPQNPAERERVEVLRGKLNIAHACYHAGKYERGHAIASAAAQESESMSYAPLRAEVLLLLGLLDERSGRAAAAEQSLIAAAEAAALAPDDHLVAECMIGLTRAIGDKQARYGEAQTLGKAAMVSVIRAGDDPVQRAALYTVLGYVSRRQGRFEESLFYQREALSLRRMALGDEHPEVATSLHELGAVAKHLGDYASAKDYFEQAAVLRRALLGDDHPDLATTLSNLGVIAYECGHYAEARHYYLRALGIREKILSEDHPDVAATLNNLGALASDEGEHALACSYYERVCAHRDKLSRDLLGHLLCNWAEALYRLGSCEEALHRATQSAEILASVLNQEHQLLAYPLTIQGACYLQLGQIPNAVTALEQALRLREGHEAQRAECAKTRFALACALWASGRERARALLLAENAAEEYAQVGDAMAAERAAVESWLVAHRATA